MTIVNTGTNFTRGPDRRSGGPVPGRVTASGTYKVTANARNFGTIVRQGLDLAVGQTVNLTLTLSVAGTTQTISVTGEAPVIERDTMEQSTYIDRNSIRTLPNNGRNFIDS